MTRTALAQTIYSAAWPGECLEDALPEIRDTFHRMADSTAQFLNITLEDQ